MTSKAFGLAQLGNVYDDGALSNRNLIINGAMQVAQRGTSSSSGGYSTVDRYYHNLSGATSTMTREEATFGQEVDGQFKYWVKLNTTVGNNYCGIQQRVEDVRSLREGRATLSFWVKGTNPASGQYLVQMQRLPAGTSGSTLDIPLDDTYTVSSTWTRKVFTFDVPALGTSVTETANSLLYITLGAQEGTDTSTDAWELNITGVQLECSDTSTPFEHRSYGDELARCQRYYYKLQSEAGYSFFVTGYAYQSTDANLPITFPQKLRAAPTFTSSGNWRICSGSCFNNPTLSQGRSASNSFSIVATTTGLTTGDAYALGDINDTTAYLAFDAEL